MKKQIKYLLIALLLVVRSSAMAEEKFSTDSLIIYMKKIGVKHIKIALQQAKLETYYFSSDIFKENKNLFGMQYAKARKTTATGKKDGYAVYTSWKKSVEDYYLWQNQFYPMTGEEDYGKVLKNRKYNLNNYYVKTVIAVYVTPHEMEIINGK